MDRPIHPRPRQPDAPRVRVQIVEDLPKVQELLRGEIEDDQRFAVSGIDDTESEALARCLRDRPDALVVDLNLREGSGLGLISAIRQHYEPQDRPLMIVVTNHTLAALQAASIKFGADHFLDKSRDLPKLNKILAKVFYP